MAKKEQASAGIAKLVGAFKETGVIKTSRATYHPKSARAAAKQAAAIEYGRLGFGRAGRTRKSGR